MSGIEWTCEHCGKQNLVMAGSPPFCSCPTDQEALRREVEESIRRREERER